MVAADVEQQHQVEKLKFLTPEVRSGPQNDLLLKNHYTVQGSPRVPEYVFQAAFRPLLRTDDLS